ncbi:MAG: DedA family protein [Rikenellaceae bacterium]|jgi:membrane protein YqaA with SNARE-associated domain|nr:DedA family protein [Rikenellaceae bacterium]
MEWLMAWGYAGLFIGAMLAATVVPFSSDVLLIALLAAGGDTVTSVVVASLGNWAGGMISYAMGYYARWEWIERWLRVKPETLEKQQVRIAKYGSGLAFFSWLPGIGDVLALGLGFYKVSVGKVALFMLIGKTARFVCWALLYHFAQPLILRWAGVE